MKILLINEVCGHTSTGKICTDIAVRLQQSGNTVKIAYGRDNYVPEKYRESAVRIGGFLSVRFHAFSTRLFDNCGFLSKGATKRFLKWVDKYNPDVIHLHNLHGYYINLPLLFDYIKKKNIRTIWTLHDCWAFTGHCASFSYEGCDKWKTGCENCPQKNRYPVSLFKDNSAGNYEKKKELFTGVKNLTVVTPSEWLKKLVEMSFLKDYPCEVIHNGIDVNMFKPIKSNIRKEYGLENKTVLLGVASVWDDSKGLDTFFELRKRLSEKYAIVLIGLKKPQIKKAPEKIICIEKTNSVEELAKWYSAADYFINPTLDDNYPSVNLEAIACDTPVITYKTGGSPESARFYGTVIESNTIEELERTIESNIEFEKNAFSPDASEMAERYLELYEKA